MIHLEKSIHFCMDIQGPITLISKCSNPQQVLTGCYAILLVGPKYWLSLARNLQLVSLIVATILSTYLLCRLLGIYKMKKMRVKMYGSLR